MKVHNPEHLMGSKQSSKSELQQQNLVSSHLTLPKNFVWGGGGGFRLKFLFICVDGKDIPFIFLF